MRDVGSNAVTSVSIMSVIERQVIVKNVRSDTPELVVTMNVYTVRHSVIERARSAVNVKWDGMYVLCICMYNSVV